MQVKITIRGRQYTVRGDEAGGDIRQIAREVDARMSEVAEHTRSFDEYTIALLTALNLASELNQLRRQVAGRLDEFDRDFASITAMIEAALPEQLPDEDTVQISNTTSKTAHSKTGTSKTGTSKTGTSKTGTSKTGTSKTGTSKTSSMKDKS